LAETPSDDFDFQSKLKEFDKGHEEGDEEAGDVPQPPINADAAASISYEKDDFFDSISCDAIDRQAGIDNRLRGSAERNLNTETFGAVALNSQRRRRRYVRGGGGGGGGGREGNLNNEGERTNSGGGRGGGGRGRGRGRGRGGRGRGRGRSGGGRGGASKENRQPA
jgi:protein LSM14